MTRGARVADALFLGALLCVSFIGVRWRVHGLEPKLADFLIGAFLIAYAAEVARRRRRPSRPALIVLACAGALGVAYLAALPNLDPKASSLQFAKGFSYFALHFAFLAAGVDHVASRSPRFFRVAFGFLLAGIAANGLYGGVQLVAAALGQDLDAALLSPVTGRPARSVMYGLMYAADVPRARGLTRDPNHLGVMLLLPTLTLLALATWQRDVRRRRAAAIGLAVMLAVAALTLSRSAGFGLAAGVVFLVLVDRFRLAWQTLLVPAGAAATVVVLAAAPYTQIAERAFGSRLGLYGFAGRQHFRTYELVWPALSDHPLFGVGLNNFDLTYAERINGIREASHSFYVQSLVDTGIVGTALFGVFLGYAVSRLLRAGAAARGRQPHGPQVLHWTLGACLVGTLAANVFYMTMTFTYFAAFLIFVVAAPSAYVRAPARGRLRAAEPPSATRVEARPV